jgi:sialate O-acetylesterase
MLCRVVVVSLLVASSGAPQAQADVTLPKLIGSHMVLQRDRPLPIWGWADPGEEVVVKLDEATASAKADAQGNWRVILPAATADGKAHRMTVSGKNKIELEDILIGEVWLGSGQSNMGMGIGACDKAKEEIPAANYPKIRLLRVSPPKKPAAAPATDVEAYWVECSPQTVASYGSWGGFSAALFYFGQRLHKDLDIPVGLIASSKGGTPIEAWIVAGPKGGDRYNGMIAPVKPFAIRGTIWYQGEANAGDGLMYADKMKTLIEGWRQVWGYDFPFYFVQLPPWSGYKPGSLPPLWEAQAASLNIAGTGMVVTTDLVDNLKNVHPKNKFDVGNRMALWALAKDYKKDLVYSGPLYKSMKVEGSKIRLSFAHVGGGLKSRDGKPLREFEIAGADGKFVPAEAAIDGDTVVVQAKEVAAPTQVRFGWHNKANPNLANKEGLPASPFQTTNWRGGTGE